MRTRISCMAAMLALVTLPAAAQGASITRVVVWKVKPGAAAKFEEGLKKHNEFHRKQNDPKAHETFQIQSGPNTGAYLRIAGSRQWQDFDAEAAWAQADEADSAVNTDPYLDSATPAYYRLLADVSRPREGDTPAAMFEIFFYKVKQGKGDAFSLAMKKVHEAIGKTQWPVHYAWFALVNGGEHPLFVLSLPRDNWAAFNPPEKPFDKMLEEAFGRAEADSIDAMLDETVAAVSSEIIAYRADLSYVPAKK